MSTGWLSPAVFRTDSMFDTDDRFGTDGFGGELKDMVLLESQHCYKEIHTREIICIGNVDSLE